VTEPFGEIPQPYQPASKTFTSRVIGSTNPVWIDADGDGKFEPAVAIAQRLIKAAGGDREKLREALKTCDEAVAVQVESLNGSGPE
jgi:hypothetical protein